MIRKANLNDLNQIMSIIEKAIEDMKSYNSTQWDENYPQNKDFIRDIENGDLYVEAEDDLIKGFVCVNDAEADEYQELMWSSNEKCLVVHRMAVNPDVQKSGVGSKLLTFAEELARKNNIYYLKTDTYSMNEKMNSLFRKFGYRFVGEMNYQGEENSFYCYEKQLS